MPSATTSETDAGNAVAIHAAGTLLSDVDAKAEAGQTLSAEELEAWWDRLEAGAEWH